MTAAHPELVLITKHNPVYAHTYSYKVSSVTRDKGLLCDAAGDLTLMYNFDFVPTGVSQLKTFLLKIRQLHIERCRITGESPAVSHS